MLFNHRKETEQGFTLTELLVIILIIGILAAIAIPLFLNQRKAAREAAVKSDLKNIGTQVEGSYDAKTQKYKTPIFVEKNNADGEGDITPGEDSFGPAFTSKGNTVTFRALGGEKFCLTGFHQDDTDNVWYFSSLTGGLSKNPASCVDEDAPEEATPQEPPSTYQCSPEVKGYIDSYAALTARDTPEFRVLTRKNYRGAISAAQYNADPIVVAWQSANATFGNFDSQVWAWPSVPELEEEFMAREAYGAETGAAQAYATANNAYNALSAPYTNNKWTAGHEPIAPMSDLVAAHQAVVAAHAELADTWCGSKSGPGGSPSAEDELADFFAATPITGICHPYVLEYNTYNRKMSVDDTVDYMIAYYKHRNGSMSDSQFAPYKNARDTNGSNSSGATALYDKIMGDNDARANWYERNVAMGNMGFGTTRDDIFYKYALEIERQVNAGTADANRDDFVEAYDRYVDVVDHWFYIQCGE